MLRNMRIKGILVIASVLGLAACSTPSTPVGQPYDDVQLAEAHTNAIAKAYSDCFSALGIVDPDMVFMPSDRGDIDGYVTVHGNEHTLGFEVMRGESGEPVSAPVDDATEALLGTVGCVAGED